MKILPISAIPNCIILPFESQNRNIQMSSQYFECAVCHISLPTIYVGRQPPFLQGMVYIVVYFFYL